MLFYFIATEICDKANQVSNPMIMKKLDAWIAWSVKIFANCSNDCQDFFSYYGIAV